MITSEEIFSSHLSKIQKTRSWLIGTSLGLLVIVVAGGGIFLKIFESRIYPGTNIDGISVGGLTPAEAKILLIKKLEALESYPVKVGVDDIEASSSSAELGLVRYYDTALSQAYEVGRVGFPLKRLWILLKNLNHPSKFRTQFEYDLNKVELLVKNLQPLVDLQGHDPQAKLNYSGSINSLVIDPGQAGREVEVNETVQKILSQAGNQEPISAQVASTSGVLNADQIAAAQKRASKLVGTRLIFRANNVRLDLNDQKLISFLTFPDGLNQEAFQSLLTTWQDTVSRPAQSAEFEYDEETLVVSKFIPHRDGLELDDAKTTALLTSTIDELTAQEIKGTPVGIQDQTNLELELPVKTTPPEITLADTNELGIVERIGFGESEYDHSIINRIHNVALTTSRISDTIIAPGEQFSFNKTLGEVSAATGYRSAYVIKDGRTELGDGGGVCQVSTTVFRAVLDAGLNITRRLPHSYRVSYYELNAKPGIDATVYAGETDFRFINDTDHHILLHGSADSENLYMKMEIYGTSDGRTTQIKDHEVWGYSSPPAAEYYPDPSLPAGVKKQIDWAVGGVKAKFTHVIKNAAGEITSEKTYNSSYRPWAAKYLVGE